MLYIYVYIYICAYIYIYLYLYICVYNDMWRYRVVKATVSRIDKITGLFCRILSLL